MDILFGFFQNPTSLEVSKKLLQLFHEFNNADDKYFQHQFRLRRDLKDYVGVNLIRSQLQEKLPGPYLAGMDIKYAHFPYIFIDGPNYGPIDPTSYSQYRCTLAYSNATALTEDLYELKYKELFKKLGIRVNKTRTLEVDAGALLNKIFDSLEKVPVEFIACGSAFLKQFKVAYEEVFNKPFFSHGEMMNRPKGTKRVNESAIKKIPAKKKATKQEEKDTKSADEKWKNWGFNSNIDVTNSITTSVSSHIDEIINSVVSFTNI